MAFQAIVRIDSHSGVVHLLRPTHSLPNHCSASHICTRTSEVGAALHESDYRLGESDDRLGGGIWVAIITVLFSLLVAYPVTDQTLNYTPVAVGGLFVFIVSWVMYAHKWFQGP